MKTVLGALIGAIALTADPVSAANLVTNGDFEHNGLSGWTRSGTVDLGSTPYVGLDDASFGKRLAIFNAGDHTADGVLSQTIATILGQRYDLRFDYGVTTGGSQALLASIFDGASNSILGSTRAASDKSLPQTFRLSFVATSSASTIRFQDSSSNNSMSQDGAIDNVSVTSAVPEPGTWVMMILGFGGLGSAMRRRSAANIRVHFA